MDPLSHQYNERTERKASLIRELRAPFLRKGDFLGKDVLYYNTGTEEYLPKPETPSENWAYVEKYLAPLVFECLKLDFEIHGSFQERKDDVKEVIKELEVFINEANELSSTERTEALNSKGPLWPSKKWHLYEYYRIMNPKFYKQNKSEIIDATADVYGKYVLYYEFLKNILDEDSGAVVPKIAEIENKPIEAGKGSNPTLHEHAKILDEIDKAFELKVVATKEDRFVKAGELKAGEEYFKGMPFPSEPTDAWQRMVNQYAKKHFLTLQYNHLQKHDEFKARSIKEEIDRLKKFIEKAEKCPIDDAVNEHVAKFGNDKKEEYWLFEYSRIAEGFYKYRNVFDYKYSTVAYTYAKYFMWLPFLEKWLDDYKNDSSLQNPQENEAFPPISSTNSKSLTQSHFINEVKQVVEEKLGFMQGVDPRKHRVILEREEFNRLLQKTIQYFSTLELPTNITTIKKANTSKGNILYTYKLIFEELYPNSTYPESLFKFLHSTFIQLRNPDFESKGFRETTMYKTLSRKPEYYDDLQVKSKK